MSNDTAQKLLKEVRAMRAELSEMRSALGMDFPTDTEGEYRPEFVRKMKRLLRERRQTRTFTSPKAFLAHIRK